MLLYVFRDGTSRQVEDNPSVADGLAVVQGLLLIFKLTPDGYKQLIIENEVYGWIPVKNAVAISCSDGKIQR